MLPILLTLAVINTPADPIDYPELPTSDVVDDFHGTAVADPFRWLEEPESRATREFVERQNALTRAYLPGDVRDRIRGRLETLQDYERIGIPSRHGDLVVYARNDGLQPQSVLYVEREGDDRVLIDPNTFSDNGTVALAGTTFTEDGSLVAYGKSVGGSDQREVFVLDTGTGEHRPDQLTNMRFSGQSWHGSAGFFYNQYPDDSERFNNKLRYHALGTDQADDPVVYERPDDKELSLYPSVTEDNDYLLVYLSRGTDRRAGVAYKTLGEDPLDGEITPLFDVQDARYSVVGNEGSVWYVLTDKDAPRRRLVSVDVAGDDPADPDNWTEIVPEGEAVLEEAQLAGSRLITLHNKDARSVLSVRDMDGGNVREVELPGEGTVYGLDAHKDRPDFTYGYTSFTDPGSSFRADVNEPGSTLLFRPEVGGGTVDLNDYTTTLTFATSKDGTRVPLFLAHKKDVEPTGDNPTILYGYGGFSVGLSPSFSPTTLAFLEQGGVFAQACLRGGDEYGSEWHEAGQLGNKQNVFDDFIASAEHLIEGGYTSPEKLAIRGGSNGGLLVAAVELQRPDLFGAVLCHVPVIDMLRYHTFGTGRFWTVEYGNAMEDPEHFGFLMAYSPLHNVADGTLYPPTLVLTADGDDRVVPAHAFKFVAELQKDADPAGVYLLRHDTDAGHGAGKPTAKRLDEMADVYAFLTKTLGFEWGE